MILLASSLESFIQLLGALVIFAFVLVITYFTTRWIGNYQKTNVQNRNLQFIESIGVGNNKFISLVKAGKVYLVVAVGKDEVTMLAQLTEEQLEEIPLAQMAADSKQIKISNESFQDILNKLKKNFPKNKV